MKTDDLRLGVRSDPPPPPPPRPECVTATKIHQKVCEGGVTVKTFETKTVQNYCQRNVKTFQNNRISHFLIVYVQKWRSDLTPRPK